MLVELLKFLCVFAVGIQSGAMVYASVLEIGVRKKMSPRAKLDNWHLVFPRATAIFKTSGICIVPALIACGWFSGEYLWYIAAATLAFLVPFTSVAIAPTNDRILAMSHDTPDSEISSAINGWDNLHHIRSILIFVTFVICVAGVTLT